MCAAEPANRALACGVRNRVASTRGRQPGPEPEPRHPHGVAGPAQHRPEHVAEQIVEAARPAVRRHRARPCRPVPSPAQVSSSERTMMPARAVVERVREVDLGVPPDQAVLGQRERGEERRRDAERVHGGADVVQQTGDGQLRGAGAAADRVLALEHRDRAARPARARPRRPARWDRSRRRPRRVVGHASCGRARSTEVDVHGEVVMVGRLAAHQVLDLDVPALDLAGRRVDEPVGLGAACGTAAPPGAPPAPRRARSGSASGARR